MMKQRVLLFGLVCMGCALFETRALAQDRAPAKPEYVYDKIGREARHKVAEIDRILKTLPAKGAPSNLSSELTALEDVERLLTENGDETPLTGLVKDAKTKFEQINQSEKDLKGWLHTGASRIVRKYIERFRDEQGHVLTATEQMVSGHSAQQDAGFLCSIAFQKGEFGKVDLVDYSKEVASALWGSGVAVVTSVKGGFESAFHDVRAAICRHQSNDEIEDLQIFLESTVPFFADPALTAELEKYFPPRNPQLELLLGIPAIPGPSFQTLPVAK